MCALYLTSRADESRVEELAFAIEGGVLAFETEGETAGRKYAGKVACCHPHGADMSATLRKQEKLGCVRRCLDLSLTCQRFGGEGVAPTFQNPINQRDHC